MVGYAPNGYRLWNKTTKRNIIARDVKFNERYFPYAADSEESEAEQLVIPRTYEQQGADVEAEFQSEEVDHEIPEAEDSALPSHSDRDVSSGQSGEPSE